MGGNGIRRRGRLGRRGLRWRCIRLRLRVGMCLSNCEAMSPATHFFTGWVLANSASLSRRERALVTLACVVPDVDGLGIVAEYLTRNSQHPIEWFSTYHHSLHSLPFAIVVAGMTFALANQRWKTAT